MYLWIKAVHVIAVISWMSGLLYLPRLFVYHCDAPKGSAQSETFKVMERRLLRVIMNPAMILAWACGITMISLDPGLLKGAGWLHAKLTLVVLMTVAHMAMARWRRAFAEDRNTHGARFFRIANEVPALMMILIVILVITRPF
ncbi:MAG: protoporphyrinogen oxidase HemJ [Azospirillaceae bacterium]|nr:protoporphyrinogen oxidase HemJ [Azospirillaceae bacterium]